MNLLYTKGINKTFKNYLDKFMNFFQNDFSMYNEVDTYMDKLKLCF